MSMEETPDLLRSRSGYQKLAVVSSSSTTEISESKAEASEGKPVRLFRSKTTNESIRAKAVAEAAKNHPIFNLGDARRRKKAMKNPDFLRYMQYVKEGGTWDANSNTPSIYFK